jgi:hypothetical protein
MAKKKKAKAKRKTKARAKDLSPRKSPKGGVAGARLGIRGPSVISAI